MAGLLRDSEHEDDNAEMGRVAEKEAPCLHLETMEDSESENTKPYEAGYTEILCPQMGLH